MKRFVLLITFISLFRLLQAQSVSARYWFDNNVATMHNGVASSGTIDLDISHLCVGMHAVHYQAFDADGVPSSVRTRYFMVDQIQRGTLSAKIWFDSDEDAAETYTLSDEDIVLDVSTLNIGLHEVSVALYNERGTHIGTQTIEFEIPVPTTSITLSSAGKGTFCWDVDLDFTDVEGLKAYIATGYNKKTGKVMMGRVTDVPAGTGIYLVGAPGTYSVPQQESYAYYVNLLVGVLEDVSISKYDDYFANYTIQSGSNGIGFYLKNGTVKAGKAYLHVPQMLSNEAKYLGIVLEDEVDESDATGIDVVPASEMGDSKTTYNLMGVPQQGTLQKGIYIRNGKKIIVH
jgi:hypothetical protein